MTLYERIQQAAKEAKISITNLEIACDLGNGTIGKWQKSMPKADKLYAVARYLNKTVEYFLNGEEPVSRNNGNFLNNSINESPNSILLIHGGAASLSKQEIELILTYRDLSIKEQVEFITAILKLKSDKSE